MIVIHVLKYTTPPGFILSCVFKCTNLSVLVVLFPQSIGLEMIIPLTFNHFTERPRFSSILQINTRISHGLVLLCHRPQLTHKDIPLTAASVLLKLTLVKKFLANRNKKIQSERFDFKKSTESRLEEKRG